MIEQIFSMIKETSKEVIEQNSDVPNEQNEAVSNIASESIVGSIQKMMGEGGIASLMGMFSGGAAASEGGNQVVQGAMSDFAGNLMNKLNLSGDKANGIAGAIIPMILSKLMGKMGSGNGFDLSAILGSLSGGKEGGIDLGSIASKLGASGLDVNNDGKTDLNDLKSKLSGLFGK